MSKLEVTSLVAGYGRSDMILKDVSLLVDETQIVCIIGPNGAGKSTLLKSVAGLLNILSGSVFLDNQDLTGLRPVEIANAGVAFVPQVNNIFPSMSVTENLQMGGYVNLGANAEQFDRMLDRFPMLAEKRKAQARSLSGGQRQVLAMAMALMVTPKVLLLDEPTAGLSPKAADELLALIRSLADEGLGIALVEQNASAALEISDEAYILVDGKNAKTGNAKMLKSDPEIKQTFLGL
jgi:branched-chain amino acid transport system ATP-binding protein/neutral amino acid transport system ATP-binding protein